MQDTNTLEALLKAPFPSEDLSWRVQRAGLKANGEPYVMVFCYVTARAVQNRLDDVIGIANWQKSYPTYINNNVVCELSLKIDGEWISKQNGAPETDIESFKGALSDSFKRVASDWGIGRYLYNLTTTFAKCSLTKEAGYEKETKVKKGADKVAVYWKVPSIDKKYLPSAKLLSNIDARKVQPLEPTKPQATEPTPPPAPVEPVDRELTVQEQVKLQAFLAEKPKRAVEYAFSVMQIDDTYNLTKSEMLELCRLIKNFKEEGK